MKPNNNHAEEISQEITYFYNEIIQRVNDIDILVQKLFHDFYYPYGLSQVQVPVLMALRRHGQMSISELSRSLEIGASNMTPLCKRLEKAGMVTRTRSEIDQRVVHVKITEHALEVLKQVEADIIAKADSFSGLAEKDGKQIVSSLDLLTNYLTDLEKAARNDR